tara:strand:+ start:299 stop:6547 length:6249 start_codon:yes stop_codon:yes gene_type:complete
MKTKRFIIAGIPKRLIIAGILGAALASQAAIYTWTGAVDGVWTTAGNWDANGVPVDSATGTVNNAGLSLAPGESIVFDVAPGGAATPLPTSAIPDLGGSVSPHDTPTIVINQGGAIALKLGGREGDVWSNVAGTRNVLTVGDGVGAAGEVEVSLSSIVSNPMLARHASSTTNNFQVNADGILNFTSATIDFGYSAGRDGMITINGGEVNLSGVVTRLTTQAARVIDFTAAGGTFTASFGGDFSDIAAVISSLDVDFVNNTGAGYLQVIDNTDGTFTVSVVETLYIGDSAAEGINVTAGTSSYSLTTLTIAMHTGSPVIYTASSGQNLTLTEVNFYTDATGTVTPFVARYDGTNSTLGSGYEILAIGDPITVTNATDHLENSAFLVGGVNPIISVNAGDQIIAGYYQTGGRVVRYAGTTSGVDYIFSGDSLTSQSVGDPLSADSTYNAFDETMKFNIGFTKTLRIATAEASQSGTGYGPLDTFSPSSTDLTQNGSAAVSTNTFSGSPYFGTTTDLGNGVVNTGDGVYLAETFSGGHFPNTQTIVFDTSVNTAGYNITGITTYAGHHQNGSALANQKYTVEYSLVGSADFISLGEISHTPFDNADTDVAAATQIAITDSTGFIATSVDAIKITYLSHGFTNGNTSVDGTVYREVDVFGAANPVIATGVSSGTDADYAADASATDLVNEGTTTLAGTPTYSSTPGFGPADNDGSVGAANTGGDITFWSNATAGQTYSITYDLNTAVNTLGYDITSLQTIHGWGSNTGLQKNQNYTVEVSTVGDPVFNNIATVDYNPFTSASQAGSSKVTVANTATGILAAGVDQIRFTYTIQAGATQASPTIREIDVFGTATTGPVLVSGVSSGTDADFGSDASATDLVNQGQGTFASVAYSTAPYFGGTASTGGANNDSSVGSAANSGDITFWLGAAAGQTYSITYDLDTAVNTLGYDITSLQTIHGWGNGSGNQKNQNYTVEVSLVGDAGFTNIATVAYLPFTSANNTASTKVNVTDKATGILASGVDEIRFIYTIPASGGTNPSPTIREIDVFGSATSTAPDTTDPQLAIVNAFSPVDGAVEVAPDGNLTVTFDEAIAIGSGNITIKNLDAPSEIAIPVSDAQVTVYGTVLTINPATDLDPNTNYAVQIAATAIDDLAGNSFAGITDDTTWNFSSETVIFIATTSPVERQVVQRDGSNLGSIPVEGTVTGSVDRIEARAVGSYDKSLGAIWFIGDSITQSNADDDVNGSPRKSLYDLLDADGASFTYTGDFAANVDGLPTTGGTVETNLYHYHSGHSGIRIGEVGGDTGFATNMTSYWGTGRLAVEKPSQILIMLGTNDVGTTGASERLRQLVEDIYALPNVGTPTIFLASIPPNGRNASDTAYVAAFNADVPGIVTDFQAEGKDVQFVDQFTPLNDDYANTMRGDNLHPNATGNDTMAQTWFDAIKARHATGITTAWQTIATSPVDTFSGALTNVAAGGWYSVEVRSIVSEAPVNTVTIDKVGVGDIYVIAGQSNSANYGSPAATPADDRVVARTSASANTWAIAADPLPVAQGSGGSAWSRLGDLLVEAENVPVGFLSVGAGGSSVTTWVPGQTNYINRLKPAIESFPVDGFRAVLWHQGEKDSADPGLSAATYEGHLNSMIAASRTDAGWSVPWYIAEASFAGRTLEKEDRITAGQRAAVHGDPLIFLGPSTDEFHLEDANGGKLTDGVHFNAAGLLDHATQWSEILLGTTTISPRNSDFEDNRTAGITGLSALEDGAVHLVDILDGDSPIVLDWRVLAASGVDSADGSNGFHNPTTDTYAGAVDSINGGVLPNMNGQHVAVLDGGTADNYFLQSTRVATEADTYYTLTVALGVRDSATSYGARLEITSNGSVVASASFDKATLDALHGSDASGSFTDASVSWTTASSVTTNQLLAIRVVKEGGAGTVIDFDNVRFTTAAASAYQSWVVENGLSTSEALSAADVDGDGNSNLLEFAFGTDPAVSNSGSIGYGSGVTPGLPLPVLETITSNNVDFRAVFGRRKDWSVAGLTYTPQFSPDLTEWVDATDTPEMIESGSGDIDAVYVPYPMIIQTTTGWEKPQFFRLSVSQD